MELMTSPTYKGSELIIDQLVRCSHFLGFIPRFSGIMRFVVSDVPVDNEAPMVTSGISRSAGPVLRKYS